MEARVRLGSGRTEGRRSAVVYRAPIDDRHYAVIDLRFDDSTAAQAFLEILKRIWRGGAEGKVMTAPQARIFEIAEEVSC